MAYVVSAPLQVTRASNVGSGRIKTTPFARGTASSYSRMSGSSLNGLLSEASERGVDAASLHKHFSLSTTQRRSVVCSPSSGRHGETTVCTPPATVTVGFNVASIQSSTFSSSKCVATAAKDNLAAKGLLSRAFTPENQVRPHMSSAIYVDD